MERALTVCTKREGLHEPWHVTVFLFNSEFDEGSLNGLKQQWVVKGTYERSNEFSTLLSYVNREADRRDAERRRQDATAAVAKELQAFAGKNRVKRFVSCSQLSTNPFAFEGEIVALTVTFDSMLERDRGLFGPECVVVVSGIPLRTFGTQRVEVLLAGKVVGKAEVKFPLGPPSVPHLKFEGVQFCRQPRCAEFTVR